VHDYIDGLPDIFQILIRMHYIDGLKYEDISDIICAFGSSKKGVDFDALDGEPVFLLFLLIAPQDSAGMHLKALAKISRLLKDRFFRQVLMEANSAEEILKVIKEEDE